MIKLLYIGNFLDARVKRESIAVLLLSELDKKYETHSASHLSTSVFRLLHMLWAVFIHKCRRGDVIVVDVFSSRAFWFAVAVGRLSDFLGLPHVLVLHGGKLPQRFIRSPRNSERLLSRATRVIAPSNYLKQYAEQIKGIEVRVIGNPLRIERYPIQSKSYMQLHLLWVRAFHAVYNPNMVLDLVKKLKNTDPSVKLTMVGPDKDGSMKRIKERIQAEDLAENIRVLGMLSKEEWIKESEKANVFINTATADNAPVSVMEAMALGIPVVSTNVGGIPYLLQDGENVLLVPDNDPEAMALSVLRVQRDEGLRKKLILNGRLMAEQIDLNRVAKEWEKLIEEVHSSQGIR